MAGVPAGRLNIEIVAEIARLQQDLDKAKKLVNGATGDIARAAKAANDNLSSIGGGARAFSDGAGKMASSSKLASHHMANLSFQIQDIIIGLQGGQKPMTVFMQQGSQIGQIMMQAGVGVGGLTKALLSMASASAIAVATNPLLLASAAAIGTVGAALGLVTAEINKNSEVTVTWQDVLLGAFDVIKDGISSKVTAAFEAMGLDIGEVWDSAVGFTRRAINLIISMSLAVPKVIAATYDKIGPAFGDAFYSAANLAIEALNWLVQKSAAPINTIIDALNSAFGTKIPRVVMDGIDSITNPYKGAMSALGKAGAASLTNTLTRDWIGETADALFDAAQKHARLRDAAEKAGKDIGGKVGKAAGKAAGDESAKELAKALDKLAEDVDDAFLKIIMDGRKAMADRAKAEWTSMMEDIEKAQAARVKPIEDAAKAQDAWNDQLRETVDLLDRIGGMGKSLGDIGAVLYALRTGNYSGVSGGLASILGPIGAMQWVTINKDDQGREIKVLRDEVSKFLDGVQLFGQSATSLLQAAGTGAAVGSILGGGSTAQIGSMAGGALGQALGTAAGKAIGGALGSAMGPLGSIAGSILGNVLGKALSGNEKGRATFSGGSFTVTGDNAQRESAANDLAKSVTDALKQIGDAFGAEVGSFTGMIGVRNSSIRYDAAGQSLKKGANFGQDSAAAIAAAISDAISDGVFTGLSDGVERLLKNGGDLETQLQKALSFQGVFDELKQMKDPQGAALDDLTKWHDNMAAIFAEAGATSDQLAQLEELTGLKRQEIVEKYGDAIANAEDIANQRRQLEIQIMQLEGKTVEALAAARQMEKAAADASLGPLYDHIYALQDQASAAAAAAQAADRMANLQIRLAQAQGNDDLVTALQLQQELAGAASDAERDLINQIYAAEAASKAAAAAEAQRQKEQAEAEEIARQRQGLMLELLRAQGKAEEALAMERQAQLLTLDQSLRALQQQVWAEQDLAQKREDAAKVVESARNALSQSYQKEAQAIQQTIDKFKGFSDTLRDLRDSLFSGTGFDDLASLQRKYNLAFTSALGGDVKGFEALPAALNAYRDAAITQAGSAAEARMITARLAQDLTRAIGSADDAADYQQLSLDALNQSVDGLIDIKEEVASVREAIADLKEALAEQTALQEQVGKTQIRAQQESNRLWRDVTDGGFGIKTQPVDA